MRYTCIIFISLSILMLSCNKDRQEIKYGVEDAELLHDCQKGLTDVIVLDIFTPPVASRIYVYPMLAAYEAGRFSNTGSKSLTAILNFFENIPQPEAGLDYDFTVAAIRAFAETSKKVIFSKNKIDELETELLDKIKSRSSSEVFDRSLNFGSKVAAVIIARLSQDNYKETRGMERFEVKILPGLWVPTPPDYADSVEPHWSKMKTLVLDSARQCRVDNPIPYSDKVESPFWNELMKVHDLVNTIDEDSDELNMAIFWDDNPFVSRHKGHLMFQDKKMTPGGHWLSICRVVSRQQRADFFTVSLAYALTSVSIFEAFISCWDTKYFTMRVRPETDINNKINKDWHPHLVTPPFPAFTSGHSTVSSAAAETLTVLFGDVAYIDSTELEYGLPIRSFTSFRQAALEASISRVYAGIHFPSDCTAGNEQGKKIAQLVIERLEKNSFPFPLPH